MTGGDSHQSDGDAAHRGTAADVTPRSASVWTPAKPHPERSMAAEETGEAFVFRDFERSKINVIRLAISRAPVRLSLFFGVMVIFWTTIMSAGAGLHGSNGIVLNLTPNITLYSAVVGCFLYPWRLIWFPILAYTVLFAYPFVQPFVVTEIWLRNDGLTWDLILKLFLLNLIAALAISIVLRGFFVLAERMWRPHIADLALSIFAFFAFVSVCLVQLEVTLGLAEHLTAQARAMVGFDPSLERLATLRIFRAGVVLTAFLLAAIEFPSVRHFRLGLLAALAYPVLALLTEAGFSLYPMLDFALFTVVVVIVLPVPAALIAPIIGVTFYSGMTGYFLNDTPPISRFEEMLETYSVVVLGLIVLILAFRSRSRHLLLGKDSSMRRLNRVRDFAGVGLFSANLTGGGYRLDGAASRLLSLDATGPISALLQCFELEARDRFTAVLARRAASGDMLTLPLVKQGQRTVVLQILVWSETSISGDDVTYGLLLDVTENADRKAALQEALDELSLRETKQRQLFSIISHEVRTPASIISMLIDDLPSDVAATAQRQLRETTDQLLAVLGDMRQAVNPEKNLPIRKEVYVPAQLAESILAGLRLTAAAAQITLSVDLDASAATPREGDIVRSRQVLTNLLRNALIHSHATNITLAFTGQRDAAGRALSVWTVTDNGRGIPPEDESSIFEPFERGAGDSRKRADGSGLGLFIAQSAVKVLGGALELQHPKMGGARFVVTLPEEERPAMPQREQKAEAKADRGLSIVLAEDNALVAEVMCARLQRDFSDVTVVANGQALVTAVMAQPPSVVLTDLFMPELDGDEATARLRAHGFKGPIIGLTAAAVGAEAERFSKAGADAVMFKPLDMAELHRLLVARSPALTEV